MMRRILATALLTGVACLAQEAPSATAKQTVRYAKDLASGGAEALPKLEGLMSDASPEVRQEAVKSIATVGGKESIDPLLRALRDNDPEVQIRATDGLVNFYLPGYVQSTLERFGSAVKNRFVDPTEDIVPSFVRVREDVVTALGKLARGGVSMESRANAARAVGVLRGKEALPDLVEALRSKDDKVIYESLVAIQKIRDTSAAPRISFLLRDLNEKVQIAAIETTGLLQNRESSPALRKVYADTGSIKVRRAAATALALLPAEENRGLYEKLFTEKDAQLRAAGAEGLGRLHGQGDRSRIETAFNDEGKMHARLGQAFALVLLGRTEISEFSPLQYLINTLNSKAYRGVAEGYLIELAREANVRETIHQAIGKGTRDEKIGMGNVLAASGNTDSVAPLEKLTKDSDSQVAEASVRALRILKARL